MDDAAFGLNESQRVLYMAGIRHLFRADPAGVAPHTGDSPVVLPDFLRSHLKKAVRKPKTVWTYLQLGDDLSGNADCNRSQLMKNLLGQLCWPRGSVVFWPFAFDDGKFCFHGYDLLQYGLSHLEPCGVVFFGAEDLSTVSNTLSIDNLEDMLGIRVCCLPDVVTLGGMSSIEFEETTATLQSFWQTL